MTSFCRSLSTNMKAIVTARLRDKVFGFRFCLVCFARWNCQGISGVNEVHFYKDYSAWLFLHAQKWETQKDARFYFHD